VRCHREFTGCFMKYPFDIVKSAQCAHFFATRAGGEIDILKLIKLLYLTDRKSFETRRVPVVGGSYYSFKHGPVTSEVLDLINDGTPSGKSPWEEMISDRADHKVAAESGISTYDALAASEIAILEEIWTKFGSFEKWDLVNWTHQHCEEWSTPDGGREEISARKLAESFDWTTIEIDEFEAELDSANRLHWLLN
jgi:uncharacterized phage-associated protein